MLVIKQFQVGIWKLEAIKIEFFGDFGGIFRVKFRRWGDAI